MCRERMGLSVQRKDGVKCAGREDGVKCAKKGWG